MRQSTILFIILVSTAACFGQGEFQSYSNGLMYNESTMNQLSHIVDSLNLKFKVCELDKTYYSKYQARGHYIQLNKGDIKKAKKDLENNIPFKEFIKKYPDIELDKDLLILKYKGQAYWDNDAIEFSTVPLSEHREYSIWIENDRKIYNRKVQDTWIFDFQEKSEYSEESLEGFFFVTEFENPPLVETYARMIQYSDCMVDTSTLIFREETKRGYIRGSQNFMHLSLEGKQELLEKMRSTRVVGRCSQDDSPRIHARNIAILSAETVNWETFLRAHLDIMNDRFDRMSDGSYASAGRQTYIRELEELDINVADLLLGISLRIENPSQNHYFGSIGRIGRALAETKYTEKIETQMLSMIKDDDLDDYNRILIYYLFLNYNHNVADENKKNENLEKLKVAVQELPEYLATKIEDKE